MCDMRVDEGEPCPGFMGRMKSPVSGMLSNTDLKKRAAVGEQND